MKLPKTVSGKGITGSETVKLAAVGNGSVSKALRRHGKRKVTIKVTYTPTGNAASSLTRKTKLVRKHAKHPETQIGISARAAGGN